MKKVKVFLRSGAAIALLFTAGTFPAFAQSTTGNNAKAKPDKPDVTITVVTNAKQLRDVTRSSIPLPAPAAETATEAVEGSVQKTPAEESSEAPEAESHEASESEKAEKQDAKESEKSAQAAEHEAEDQAKEAESQAKEAESEAKNAGQNGADDGSGDGGSNGGSNGNGNGGGG